MRGWMIVGTLLLAAAWASATVMGNSSATTRYFTAWQKNQEYVDPGAERRPTRQQVITEVTGYWQLFLRAYRAIDADPALSERLAPNPPRLEVGTSDGTTTAMRAQFRAQGLTDAAIDAQGTQVYTLQLAAYTQSATLRRFLQRIQGQPGDGFFDGTGIYRQTAKDFRLGYDNEFLNYKADPVYIEPFGRFTRVRYGIYASQRDAERDAAVWRSRYGVEPWITTADLSEALVGNVLWGALPGVYTPRD